jgi:hypothetical protein
MLKTRITLMDHGWMMKDPYGFDYETFYDRVVDLFKDRENPWVKKTLMWWNKYAYSLRCSDSNLF